MLVTPSASIVCSGDSITNGGNASGGYVDTLRRKFATDHAPWGVKVYGAGVSGDTTQDLVTRWDRDVLSRSPKLVTIFIGVNDAGKEPNVAAPVSAAAYEANLRSLVARTRAVGAVPLLATPAVRGEKKNNANPMDARLDQYAGIMQAVAADLGTPFLDLRSAFKNYLQKYNTSNLSQGVLTKDGVHPLGAGYEFLALQFGRALLEG